LLNQKRFYANYRFHQNRDLTFSQGLISIGGAVAGAIFGLGVDLLCRITEPPVALTLTTIAAWTGYLGSLQLTIGSEKVGRNDQRFHLFLENVAFVLTAAKFNQSEQSNFSLLPKIT